MASSFEFNTKQWIIFWFFIVLVLYSLFQARFLILGPRISIISPRDGASVQTVVEVKGQAFNAAWLSLDDRQIFTDENGYFNEKLIVPAGLGIITVRAKDRFGREREKVITVINRND